MTSFVVGHFTRNGVSATGLGPTYPIFTAVDVLTDLFVVPARTMTEIGASGTYKVAFPEYDATKIYLLVMDGGPTLSPAERTRYAGASNIVQDDSPLLVIGGPVVDFGAQVPPLVDFGSRTFLGYQGRWDANRNVPRIPSANAVNRGSYFIVTVPGNAQIDDNADWRVGDWLVSNGVTWDRLENSKPLISRVRVKQLIPADTEINLAVASSAYDLEGDLIEIGLTNELFLATNTIRIERNGAEIIKGEAVTWMTFRSLAVTRDLYPSEVLTVYS